MSTERDSSAQAWMPTENDHTRECQNCGARVGPKFVRFYSGRDGKVHACPDCAESKQALRYHCQNREHPKARPGVHHGGTL
jgi:hypothetical protein